MPPSNLLLSSKVVMLEEPPQIRNITGVPTSVAAFVGVTERGPVNVPTYVTSYEEFVQEFGGHIAESMMSLAILGHFQNGGVGCWINRILHYTDIDDNGTGTGVEGTLTISDRGGAAAAAILDSVAGPFNLEAGQVLEINIDGGGADTLTFAATGATGSSATGTKDLSGNNKTFTYVVRAPRETALQAAHTITFIDSDFVAPAAATIQEIVNAINARGRYIRAELAAGPVVKVTTTKLGAGATMVVTGTAGAILGGTLVNATYSGGGNVADIDAVTATEIAGLLTGLTIASGTATAIESGSKVRLQSTATGTGADVVITANTTATGIFAGGLPITQLGTAAGLSDTLTVTARDPGQFIEDYEIVIDPPTSGDADAFNLLVTKAGVVVRNESYPNLSMDPTHDRYAVDYVNVRSKLIVLSDENSAATSPNDLPAEGTYDGWANADNGLTSLADTDFIGSDAGDTGIYALDVVDDLNLLMVPGRATVAVHNAMVAYCLTHRVGLCFTVLDPPSGLDEQQIKTYVDTTAGLFQLANVGAIYWPRVKVLNPDKTVFGTEEYMNVPPSGHVSGRYVGTDQTGPGGVYQNPAGTEFGLLLGVVGFETDDTLDERKRDVVYPININPITRQGSGQASGPRFIDGSRTLKNDGNFNSVAEQRGTMFIKASLKRGLAFAKHRNNDRRLRAEVSNTVEAFLLRQYNNGAFRGNTPGESFTVDVSDAINPPEVVLAGELRVRIGLATQRPAEFIVVTLTQDTRALEERLANVG